MSTKNLFDMSDKVALVTGGSRGLGREMALAFADHGADVIIASRKLENCETVANEVRERGRRALAVAYHAASWSGAEALAKAAYDEFGRIDVLVNNAGMSPLYETLEGITEDLYDKVLDVNLKGPFR
ncbi:MAG: SDR family NAD(P)-dependent oxidoreductase, partial [Actinomycetota bacterium]